MRILVVQDTDWIERYPIQHIQLAERLTPRGHDIRVIDFEILWQTKQHKELFSMRQVFQVSRIFKGTNIMVIRPSILKVPILDYISMLFTYKTEIDRQIREFNPEVIISHGVLTAWLAIGASKKAGIPFVYYCLELSYLHIPIKIFQPLGKEMTKRVLELADSILVTTKSMKEAVIKMNAPFDRTQVLEIGVDLKLYDPNDNGAIIRKKFGFSDHDIVLLFVGSIYNFSGLKEVCIQLAKSENEQIKLLVVGDGDAYEELQKTRDIFKLEERVILTGRKEPHEIPQFIAASNICLLPALSNELMRDLAPTKVYEYMAGGKPIISTKLHGMISEFGINNGIVYVDQPEDIIAKAVELANSMILGELGLKARRYVESKNWNIITNKYEKILYNSAKKLIRSTIA
jgi:glycosyltransferase involved in cell wall biosynthesis